MGSNRPPKAAASPTELPIRPAKMMLAMMAA